jgi:ribonucleoside-triphosphate reductase (formate)
MSKRKLAEISKSFDDVLSTVNKDILKIEGLSSENFDIPNMVNKYVNKKMITVDFNANVAQKYTYQNMLSEVTKSHIKYISLKELYELIMAKYGQDLAEKVIKKSLEGDYYLHNNTHILPYCVSISLLPIITDGIKHNTQLIIPPPKTLSMFINNVIEYVCEAAGSVAGAVALGDLFPCINYYMYDKSIKENIELIKENYMHLLQFLNMPLRPSHQSLFTNISFFDIPNNIKLFGKYQYFDIDRIMELQSIFIDLVKNGDAISHMPYRFPIMTFNLSITNDRRVKDEKTYDNFIKANMELGCFNIFCSQENKITNCCRLISELGKFDSFGNGHLQSGSLKVITINLARIGAKVASNIVEITKENYNLIKSKLISLINEDLNEIKIIHEAYKELMLKYYDIIPILHNKIISLYNLFMTIGINGLYECIYNITNGTMAFRDELTKDILEFIALKAKEFSVNGKVFNIEQVPAEGLAPKNAKKDEIFGYNKYHFECYSNQFEPLTSKIPVEKRIEINGKYSRYLNGGSIIHINLNEKLEDSNQMKAIIQYGIENGAEHFAFNFPLRRCSNGHSFVGNKYLGDTIGIELNANDDVCPINGCNSTKIERMTRIVGYFVPLTQFEDVRKKECLQRYFSN